MRKDYSSIYVCVCESEVAQCVRLFATLWTVAHQAPPSMGFSGQEYWSRLPLPSPSSAQNAVKFLRIFQPNNVQEKAVSGFDFT